MTAADDCGLNLVYDPPSSLAGAAAALGGGGQGNKPAKRAKNKYDRRREKGRRAKELAEQKKRTKSSSNGGRGVIETGGGRGREVADGQSSASIEIEAETKSDPPGSRQTPDENEASDVGNRIQSEEPAERKPQTEVSDVISPKADKGDKGDDQSGRNDDVPSNDGPPEERQTTVPPTPSTAQPAAPPAKSDAPSSRRHHGQTAENDEAARAAYLSEFHARPRDLDRGERASRTIKSSVRSDHIFAAPADGGNDENRVEDGDRNDDGGGEAASSCPFAGLGLHSSLVSTLTSESGKFRLDQPTIVQSESISALLSGKTSRKNKRGKKGGSSNLLIQSETGSGKTLAYLLPIVQSLAVDSSSGRLKKVDRAMGGTRCVVLCPTRELATQTYKAAMDLCAAYPWIVPGCLSGGEKRKSEKARLRKGISLLVATPGRLLDHLGKTECLLLSLKGKLEWLVLDEADRLLDAGLGHQIGQIVQHLRSNQPRAGPGRDGFTWRSVLVSATISREMEGLAGTMLGGGDGWVWARGRSKGGKSKGIKLGGEGEGASDEEDDGDNKHSSSSSNGAGNGLDHSAPRQLAQLYMVVSAKLRLASLVAFLAARAAKKERTVVFMSTCDGVDYHHALFNAAECVLGESNDKDDSGGVRSEGILGKKCPVYKLHGDVPHDKRLSTLESFGKSESAVLLATDVAARGLNFPDLDWIVQYDPPCETKDYVHRAGRSARAGRAGHALLFLLPSERQYVEVLRLRGLPDVSPLSLSATLTKAAELCPGVAQEGSATAAGNKFSSDGRGESFTSAVMTRFEQTVLDDDAKYKKDMDKKFKGMDQKQRRKLQRKEKPVGPLLEGARKAFSAFVRAYPAKERAVRPIFNARALHLGHVARSLALKDAPRMVSKGSGSKGKRETNDDGRDGKRGEKRKSRLAFDGADNGADDDGAHGKNIAEPSSAIGDDEQGRYVALLGDAVGGSMRGPPGAPDRGGRGGDGGGKRTKTGGGDARRLMMENAARVQAQEFM